VIRWPSNNKSQLWPPGVLLIEFRDVTVCYAPEDRYPVNALEGVNLKIADGEWVFLVGPSGAGKSTLMKLLYAGEQATKGSVLVNGHEVTRLTPKEIPLLRRELGVIFQDFQLLPQKTVWENVAFALQVIGAPQKQLVRDVPRALETVGLAHKMQSRPHQLSGGEQQRVAIARAIVNNPKLLVADEPTGNLDPQTGADIVQVLQRINDTGTTIVMATHDRAVVDTLKRRVVRLAEGRIVSDEIGGEYHPEDGVLQQPRVAAPVVSLPNITSPIKPQSTLREPARVQPASIQPTREENTPVGDAQSTLEPALPRNGHHIANGQHSTNGQRDATGQHDTAKPAQTVREERVPELPATESQVIEPRRPTFSERTRARMAARPQPVSPETPESHAPLIETSKPRDVSVDVKKPEEAEVSSEREAPPLRTWAEESLIDKQRKNQAPLGSPENPLVQFDRAPISDPKHKSRND
jgi:cell division transport system ATP-binding protein